MHLSSGAGSLDVFEYNVLPLHAKDLWYIALVHAYAFLSYSNKPVSHKNIHICVD